MRRRTKATTTLCALVCALFLSACPDEGGDNHAGSPEESGQPAGSNE